MVYEKRYEDKYRASTRGRINIRYKAMKQRCYYKKSTAYKNYGGRGISVCPEWLESFDNFYNWSIKNGYENNLQLDRIDNNGDYTPNNCRWVTRNQNCMNKRNNKTNLIKMTRICRTCSLEKKLNKNMFHTNNSKGSYGFDSQCKDCSNRRKRVAHWNNKRDIYIKEFGIPI